MANRKKSASQSSARLTADQILGLLAAAHGPASWQQLVQLTGANDPKAITALRKMLKGLERNDEIKRDQTGLYHLPATEPVTEALVRRTGKTFHAAGAVIENAHRLSLREGDAVEMRVVDDRAHVLRVISHAEEPVTGVLQWQGKHAYVDALGAYRGRVSLLENPMRARHGDTVQARIVDRDQRGLVGIVTRVIETGSVLEQAIETAVSGAHIPDQWPPEVDQAVTRLPNRVQAPGRYAHRADLTGMPLVTIDGETAKDFDDAVFVEARRGGGWRLVVAIADVGHYVKPNAPIDDEAQRRGTSVYFPQRVIPMLPEALSNELCSLRPEVNRLALVCDMQVNASGEVTHGDFCEAVIHSHARLTYTQVQAFLDEGAALPVAAAAQARSGAIHQRSGGAARGVPQGPGQTRRAGLRHFGRSGDSAQWRGYRD